MVDGIGSKMEMDKVREGWMMAVTFELGRQDKDEDEDEDKDKYEEEDEENEVLLGVYTAKKRIKK